MTKQEELRFSQWNREITTGANAQQEVGRAIEAKYLKLNGSRSCNPETFVFKIANTASVSRDERIRDIRDYLAVKAAEAKLDALLDILSVRK